MRVNETSISKKHNWPLLAGLRFFLALVVMTGHLGQQFSKTPGYLQLLVPFGTFTCVVGFLLVSGYSICHSYSRSPNGFYQRRFDRIFPTFLAAFLLSMVPFGLQALHPSRSIIEPPASVFHLLANALPLQTIFVKPLSSNGVTWSLGVECAFYAFAPLFARLSSKRLWCLVGLSALVHFRIQSWGVSAYHSGDTPFIALGLMWAWLIGWIIYIERDNIWLQRLAIPVIAAIYGLNQQTAVEDRFVFVTLSVVGMILLYQSQIVLAEKARKIATYLGDLSYPLYLVHLPVFFSLKILRPDISPIIPFACGLLASVVVFHVIDFPARFRARKKQMGSKLSGKIMPVIAVCSEQIGVKV